jgi:hypothetical protein
MRRINLNGFLRMQKRRTRHEHDKREYVGKVPRNQRVNTEIIDSKRKWKDLKGQTVKSIFNSIYYSVLAHVNLNIAGRYHFNFQMQISNRLFMLPSTGLFSLIIHSQICILILYSSQSIILIFSQ